MPNFVDVTYAQTGDSLSTNPMGMRDMQAKAFEAKDSHYLLLKAPMNTQKFENLLHRFLAEVCLDLKVADNKGRLHQPREWFIAPLDVINRAIELIIAGQIQHYQYHTALKKIVAR